MQSDEEGFLYPIVDTQKCIDCGLCENVCPIINRGKSRSPINVFAAKNNNEEIRIKSSSGGIFTLLAEKIIIEGGVVFGAKFDKNWDVKHGYTETIEGLAAFRGSKYVQSQIEDNYQKAEKFLKQGRKVLFSGTPCQIAGLKCFLRKEYENLTTIDFICHGVPSPGVWRKYLKETVIHMCEKKTALPGSISKRNTHIESISFRDKNLGWKKYSFTLTLSITSNNGIKNTVLLQSSKYKNPFLIGFLRDLYLRPSCHQCPAKEFNSGSDVTIADFWGINKYMKNQNDHKGHSLIFIHNQNLQLPTNNMWSSAVDINDICKNNIVIYRSAIPHKNRTAFFSSFRNGSEKITNLIYKYATVGIKKQLRLFIANLLKN